MLYFITADQVHINPNVGNFMALSDTEDPAAKGYTQYHVDKVINIVDVQNYTTQYKNAVTAKWSPLYQMPTGVYTITNSIHNATSMQVIGMVDEYMSTTKLTCAARTCDLHPRADIT